MFYYLLNPNKNHLIYNVSFQRHFSIHIKPRPPVWTLNLLTNTFTTLGLIFAKHLLQFKVACSMIVPNPINQPLLPAERTVDVFQVLSVGAFLAMGFISMARSDGHPPARFMRGRQGPLMEIQQFHAQFLLLMRTNQTARGI